jgi:hypothetical protein
MGRSGAIVIGIHVIVIALLFWKSAELLAGSGDGPGPRGGGGGGGRQALHVFLLAGAGTPQAVPIPPIPQFSVKVPLPTTTPIDLPKLQPPPVETQVAAAPGTGNGTTRGPGEGPGSGGGKGAGTGTGAGNDSGPGHGGGPHVLMASPKLTILPPPCFRGHVEAVVSVSADGQVTDVRLDPPLKDADCRETMVRQIRADQFYPAKTLEGIPVTSVVSLHFSR